MAKRWLWFPGVVAAALLLAATLAPRPADAQRTVDLVGANCTAVALTYENGTGIATVAAAVAPAGALDSIWEFLAAEGRWIGYAAGVPPEAADLQSVDRLDVVFICVGDAATMTMPEIQH